MLGTPHPAPVPPLDITETTNGDHAQITLAGATMSDAGTARQAAELADLSRTPATAAHLDAATVHAVAARAYELAAEADPARADEHRRRAQWHHAEAAAATHHAEQEQRS